MKKNENNESDIKEILNIVNEYLVGRITWLDGFGISIFGLKFIGIKKGLEPIAEKLKGLVPKDKFELLVNKLESINISNSKKAIFKTMFDIWDRLSLSTQVQLYSIAYLTQKKDRPSLSLYLAGLSLKTAMYQKEYSKVFKNNLKKYQNKLISIKPNE